MAVLAKQKVLEIPPVRVEYGYGLVKMFGKSPWDSQDTFLASFSHQSYPLCCGAGILTAFSAAWDPSRFRAGDFDLNGIKKASNHEEQEEVYISMLAEGIKRARKEAITYGCSTGTMAGVSSVAGSHDKYEGEKYPYPEYLYKAFIRAGFKELCTFVNPIHNSKIWMIGGFSTKPEFATVGNTDAVSAEKQAE